MAYSVVYKSSVRRDLKKIAKAEARRLLDRIEKDLSRKPLAHPALKGDFVGLRKFRVGPFRVIYVVLDKEIVIIRISHRKDVYR